MRQSIFNEAEHRRGLVLGFTLAEVLLLLLFLLLLILGARLVDLQRRVELQRQLIDSETSDIAHSAPDKQQTQSDWIKELERENEKLRVALLPVVPLMDEAQRINPRDPPAALKRGLAILKNVGYNTPLAEVRRLSPEIAAVIDHASNVNSNNPAAVLRSGLTQLAKAAAQIAEDQTEQTSGKHDWPPIISLSEADGYFFHSGSAELSPKFRAAISKKIVGELLEIVRKFEGVNVVEVVGHTDEQPFAGRPSNLDLLLPRLLRGESSDRLIPSDNAGLGLARAVSVARVLLDDPRLSELRILPMSGAQLISTGDTLSVKGVHESVRQRRRIEIRLRRSDRIALPEKPDAPKITPPFASMITSSTHQPVPPHVPPELPTPKKSCNLDNWYHCW